MIDFDGNRFGRTGNTFERKTLDLLKNNDRLNEQILRRCREIVGEWGRNSIYYDNFVLLIIYIYQLIYILYPYILKTSL